MIKTFNDALITPEEKKEFEKNYQNFFSLLKKSSTTTTSTISSSSSSLKNLERPQSSRILNNDDKRKSIVNKPGKFYHSIFSHNYYFLTLAIFLLGIRPSGSTIEVENLTSFTSTINFDDFSEEFDKVFEQLVLSSLEESRQNKPFLKV